MHNTAKRPTIMAPDAMVTTPHYLASQAALEILQQGGNAVEAAISAASVLSVVYPHMNSIGGDNFWLIYDSHSNRLSGLNASGRSGEKADIKTYKSLGYNKIPARGYLAANTVPGTIAGWQEAYNYSQKNMKGGLPWESLLKRAVSYAENGFAVTPSQEHWTRVNIDPKDNEFRNLSRFEEFRKIFLKPDGGVYKTGEIFKQKDLAGTLKIIAEKGADVFYKGEIAEKLAADLEANGALLILADFHNNTADWVEPISVEYRNCTAYNLPPCTQGMASLSILNILNNFELKTMEEGTADYYHVIIEAVKLAFFDRDQWLTDPDFVKIPLPHLLSKEHGARLAGKINLNKVLPELKPLDTKGDTVWLGVVDKDGNAVSLIQSIYHDFGSAIVGRDTGILLQNRGSFFSLNEQAVNCLEPRKRTFHTLNPAMLFKDGRPYLVYGTMGGEGQPQTQAAIVTRIVDFGFNVQDAIEAPRWLYGRTLGIATNDLKLEGRISKEVAAALAKRGHCVKIMDDYTDLMGHSGAILIDPANNIKHGGADLRGDGAAAGY